MSDAVSLKNKITVVVLGRSGSGKGTQARFILARLGKGAYHMETGRFLREVLKRKNPTTKIGQEIMDSGRLFPVWFVIYTWLRELISHGHADRHLVYDGAPRRLPEAKMLDEVITTHGRPLPVCIYVDVRPSEVTRRLLERGRADDTRALIRNRLSYFPIHVLPVIRYYRTQGRLIHINGNRPVEAVWRDIDRILGKRFKKLWPRRPKK